MNVMAFRPANRLLAACSIASAAGSIAGCSGSWVAAGGARNGGAGCAWP